MLAKGIRDAFAAFNVTGSGLDCLLHHHIANGLRNDLQHFEDGDTAANERGQGASETRETNLVGNRSENREFDSTRIPELAADRSFDEVKPAVNAGATGR